MKATVKIPHMVAEMIALCYQNLNSAREYARAISSDADAPSIIKPDFISVAASISTPLDRIDKRIPASVWEQFKTQVKEADAIRLDNIKGMYVRMLPEQQEVLEKVTEAILKNEFKLEEL